MATKNTSKNIASSVSINGTEAPSQVQEQLGNLVDTVDYLEQKMQDLIKRLDSVLVEESVSPDKANNMSSLVPLAFSIREQRVKIENICDTVSSILDRIEL